MDDKAIQIFKFQTLKRDFEKKSKILLSYEFLQQVLENQDYSALESMNRCLHMSIGYLESAIDYGNKKWVI